MSTPRPTGVTVMAILAIVFGGLGICSSAFALPLLVLDRTSDADVPVAFKPYLENDLLLTHAKLNAMLGVAASVLLLTAGIGMLGLRPWARTMALIWAAWSILSALVGIVILFGFYMPALDVALQGVSAAERNAAKMGGVIGGFAAGCIGLVLPIAVWVVLTRPKVKAAFGVGPGPGPLEPQYP